MAVDRLEVGVGYRGDGEQGGKEGGFFFVSL